MNRKEDKSNLGSQRNQSGNIQQPGYGSSQAGGADANQRSEQGFEQDAGMRNVRQQDRAKLKEDYDSDTDRELNQQNRAGEQTFDRDKSMY